MAAGRLPATPHSKMRSRQHCWSSRGPHLGDGRDTRTETDPPRYSHRTPRSSVRESLGEEEFVPATPTTAATCRTSSPQYLRYPCRTSSPQSPRHRSSISCRCRACSASNRSRLIGVAPPLLLLSGASTPLCSRGGRSSTRTTTTTSAARRQQLFPACST